MMKEKIKKLMKTEISGEITIEASIVVPMVILILAFVLFVSFYLHDIVVTSAFSYGRIIEINNMKNSSSVQEITEKAIKEAPLFVAKNSEERIDKEKVTIVSKYNFPMKWIKVIMDNSNETVIEVEKNMNTEIMYIYKTVLDLME